MSFSAPSGGTRKTSLPARAADILDSQDQQRILRNIYTKEPLDHKVQTSKSSKNVCKLVLKSTKAHSSSKSKGILPQWDSNIVHVYMFSVVVFISILYSIYWLFCDVSSIKSSLI